MRSARVVVGTGVLAAIALLGWIIPQRAHPRRDVSSGVEPVRTGGEPPVAIESDGASLRATPAAHRPADASTDVAPNVAVRSEAVVRGRVRDRDGSTPPPPGGCVVLVPQRGASRRLELRPDGTFEGAIPIPPDSPYGVAATVNAFVDGWAFEEQNVQVGGPDDAPVNLVRAGVGRIEVRVAYADGRAAAFERVAFSRSMIPTLDGIYGYDDAGALDERALAGFDRGTVVARTDGGGRCTIELIEPAWPVAGRRETLATSDPSPVRPETKAATVTLKAAYGVALRFVDAESKEPISNAEGWLTEHRGGGGGSSWGFGGLYSGLCGFRQPILEKSLPVRIHVLADGRSHVGTAFDVELTESEPFATRTIPLAPFGPTNSGVLVLSTPWTAARPGHTFNLLRTKKVGNSTHTADLPVERTGPDRWAVRMAPGAHELRLVVAYEHAEELDWRATVEIRTGETTTVEPKIPPSGVLHVVADPPPMKDTNFPLHVVLSRGDGRPFWSKQTVLPAEGWTLPFVPVGAFVLRVGTSVTAIPHPFTIDADRTTEVTLPKAELSR